MTIHSDDEIIKRVADAILYPEFHLTISTNNFDKLEIKHQVVLEPTGVTPFLNLPELPVEVNTRRSIHGTFREPIPCRNLHILHEAVCKGRPVCFVDSPKRWLVTNVHEPDYIETSSGRILTGHGLMHITVTLVEME